MQGNKKNIRKQVNVLQNLKSLRATQQYEAPGNKPLVTITVPLFWDLMLRLYLAQRLLCKAFDSGDQVWQHTWATQSVDAYPDWLFTQLDRETVGTVLDDES